MSDRFSDEFSEFTTRDAKALERRHIPSLGEYASASMSQAFDRTSGARLYENADIAAGEGRAPFVPYDLNDFTDLSAFNENMEPSVSNPPALSREAWEKSAWHRKKIPWEEGMTEERARIYAENFDKRRERERVVRAGDERGPWWYGPVGFGAGLIGSLPDPVNLIPFGGAALTGARLAGMTAMRVFRNSLAKGVAEGAAGNLVSSGFAAWDLNRKGEDITAQDVLLDTMFGAAAGPLFHAGGSFLARSVARSGMRADLGSIVNALDEDSPLRGELSETLSAMGRGEAPAYAGNGETLAALRETGVVDALRQGVLPRERMELARALEKALLDVSDGRPVGCEARCRGVEPEPRLGGGEGGNRRAHPGRKAGGGAGAAGAGGAAPHGRAARADGGASGRRRCGHRSGRHAINRLSRRFRHNQNTDQTPGCDAGGCDVHSPHHERVRTGCR
jgi:hypothetical protein